MEFASHKLKEGAASVLKRVPVDSVKPYALLESPMYVFMRRNGKFVAVKAPLDFFLPHELDRLAQFKNFYVPPSVDEMGPFKTAGRSIRAHLSWREQIQERSGENETFFSKVVLAPSSFERSDAVLRTLAPLWRKDLSFEPFLIFILSNQLCDVFPEELMEKAREESVVWFETAILRSSLAVFLALLMGYDDLEFLNDFRQKTFRRIVFQESPMRSSSLRVIENWVDWLIPEAEQKSIPFDIFAQYQDRLAKEISGRLHRVQEGFQKRAYTLDDRFGIEDELKDGS